MSSCSSGVITSCLCAVLLVSAPASAQLIVDLPVTADGELIDRGNDGSFESIRQDGKLQITSFRNASQVPFEVRAAMEFDLSGVPLDRELISASFFGVVTGTGTPPGFTELSFDLLGYSGDGQIELIDAEASGDTLGVLTIAAGFPGFGLHEVPLDRDFIADRVADGGYLGLLARSEVNTGSISIESSRGFPVEERPFVRLTFVPEPSTALIALTLGLMSAMSGRHRRMRDASSGAARWLVPVPA